MSGQALPGWYPQPDGSSRWWDGINWTNLVTGGPGTAVSDAPSGLATLVHLPVGGFILPLIVFAIEGKKNRFTRYHALEALNFHLFTTAISVVGMVIAIPVLFASMASTLESSEGDIGPPVGFLVIWGVGMAVGMATLVLSLIAMYRAHKGERFRYPVPHILQRFVSEDVQVGLQT